MSGFTWLPFFEEMLKKICTEYDKFTLCKLCHEIFGKSGGLADEFSDDDRGPLKEIDPLTFIGYFNRQISDKSRIDFCELAKGRMGLNSSIPADFDAIPRLNNMNAWFFTYSKKRGGSDINDLWDFSKALNESKLQDELFKKVLSIRKVGLAKLTVLMFICKPSRYISLDTTNVDFFQNEKIQTALKHRDEIPKSNEPYLLYEKLLNELRKHFGSKTFYEISHEAYIHRSDEAKTKQKDANKAKHWVIAPGENARLWNDFLGSGLMAVGADKLGDYRQYAKPSDFFDAIKEHYDRDNPTMDSKMCFDFAYNMKLGDIVFAKKGTSKLVGYGEIVSDIIYEPLRHEYTNTRKVKWLNSGMWDVPKGFRLPVKTLTDISEDVTKVNAYLSLVRKESVIPRTLIDDLNPGDAVRPDVFTAADALSLLFMSENELDDALSVLKYKRNVILQGPPGVGKTFIARLIAYVLVGRKDNQKVQMIQFHQSYSYEDFIQGYRPNDDGKFDLKNGIFYEFCKKAQRDIDNNYVFIIDEINRGNLSKILGELMMLIEADKRGADYAVALTYAKVSEDRFYVPPNVYLVGTMNTADRSLAMIDYALRRRFRFIELWPQFNSQKFKKFLLGNGVEDSLIETIIDKFGKLNRKISEDQKDLGPGYQIGHSFFCPNNEQVSYDRQWYELVIRHEIEPLLKEYWFDDSSKVKDLVTELLG